MAHGERLGETDQSVIDRAVTVRVVARHRVTRHAGTLHKWSVGAETLLLHVPNDATVDWLETVANIGQRSRHDDRHRVLQE